LISYRITDLNPLKLDESVSGTGYLCGSIFLDDRFEQYIRRVLGNDAIDGMKARSKSEMMRTWEEKVKMRFGNTTDTESCEVNVPGIPDNARKRVEDGFHTMEYNDVKQIFDPIVDRIVKLVKKQVRGVQKKGEKVTVSHLGFPCLDWGNKYWFRQSFWLAVLAPPSTYCSAYRPHAMVAAPSKFFNQ
jgi:hypothetical protein